VRAFQERHELGVDGDVGPQTWERLNALAQEH
jgi:peptidoglycan hydrolase-like protein with peptidoglycan-binding domain